MWELAEKNGLRSMTGHQGHFDAACLHMAELFGQGYVGTPLVIRSQPLWRQLHNAPAVLPPLALRPERRWASGVQKRSQLRTAHGDTRAGRHLGQRQFHDQGAGATRPRPARHDADEQPGRQHELSPRDRGRTRSGPSRSPSRPGPGPATGFEVYGTDGMLMLVDAREACRNLVRRHRREATLVWIFQRELSPLRNAGECRSDPQ